MSTLFAVRMLIANNISLTPMMGMGAHGISTQSIVSLFEIQFLAKKCIVIVVAINFSIGRVLKRKKATKTHHICQIAFIKHISMIFFSLFGSVRFG